MVVLPLPAGPETRIAPEVSPREVSQRLEHVGRQAEVVETLVALRAAEEPHHRPLAVQGGIGADAHFYVGQVADLSGSTWAVGNLSYADAAFLRPIGVVGQQPGQNLQPGDDVAGDGRRQRGNRQQHAVDAELQFQARRPGCR